MARSLHRARTVIDATLLERLETLAGAIIARMPEAGYLLVNKLTSAKVLPPARLPDDVITIGSQVLYRDANVSRDVRVILSWPELSGLGRGRVSVLSPIGAALLGLSAGSRVRWKNRAGVERDLTVLEVAPEAEASAVAALQDTAHG
jgi:regulator of nucleoside diphosphate kinase